MIISKPNLPDKKVSCIIADCNSPKELFSWFDNNKVKYIKSAYITNIIDAVSTHPDMQICHLYGNNYICEPSVYEYYYNELTDYGINLIKGSTYINSNYPYDTAYNVVITGSCLIHNTKYTDRLLLEYADKINLSIYDVKQGYTKCATCVIDDNAVITADYGLYKCLSKNGIDCLLIDADNIMLGNRTDGFFGGCCGMVDKNKLLFCGDITMHKSYIDIKKFADKYGISLISSHKGRLTDIGSIIPVMQE